MYSVMVADDEPKIRRGLCRFIGKSDVPLTICAQAADGMEALELLRSECPDIVLLDICMPNMDGLAFLAQAKRSGAAKSKFIVITGYDDFAYAQKSVALHAFAYLLKPIDETELLAFLRAAVAELDAESIEEQKSRQALAQLEQNKSLLRDAFDRRWMNGDMTDEQWREEAAFWGVEWPEAACLSIIKPDTKLAYSRVREQAAEQRGIASISAEAAGPLNVLLCAQGDDGCCVLVTEQTPSEAWWAGCAAAMLEELKLTCLTDSMPFFSPGELPQSISSLKSRITEREQKHPLLEEIRESIDKNYSNPAFCLAELAKTLNTSQSYISRLMKSELSSTFVDYLTAKRINEAIVLMAKPENKLSWISARVGYLNQHYFSTVFKKQIGISPSLYRSGKFSD